MKTRLLQRNVALTLFLAVLLVCTTVAPARRVVFENALFTAVDGAAEEYVDQALKRALITYGVARATNAVISLFQGTELNLEPGGMGVTLTPGQVLDPVNDLVERFSWLMLASILSLGIQKFLIEVGSWVSVQILLTLALTLFLIQVWSGDRLPFSPGLWARYLLAFAIVIRFCVPAVSFMNHIIYRQFLEEKYQLAAVEAKEGNRELNRLAPGVEDMGPQNAPTARAPVGESLWDRTKQFLGGAREAMSLSAWQNELKDKYEAVKTRSARLIENYLNLALVFALNTIILPVLFLWAVLFSFRSMTGSALAVRLERRLSDRIAGSGPGRREEGRATADDAIGRRRDDV